MSTKTCYLLIMNLKPAIALTDRRDFLGAAATIMAGVLSLTALKAIGAEEPGKPRSGSGLDAPSGSARIPLPRAITVYKDPNCGCCKEWVKHVSAAGFTATVHDTADMDAVKRAMGVPEGLASCHTARVGTYIIEGHVPADLIERLLTDAPVARGLAVPGMPMGSPGMEMGGRKDKFDVMLFDKTGKSRVFASR